MITAVKYMVYLACGFECVAGFTRRAPTISQLVGRRRRLGIPIIVALSVHFYWPQEKRKPCG